DDIIQEEIQILLNTPIPLQAIRFIKNSSRNSSRPSNLVSTPLSSTISKEYEIRPNAAAQKASYEKIKTARNKITEFESLYNIASDTSIRSDLAVRIQEQKDISQHSARKSRNSNSAIHEFIYSQPYVLIEPYVSTQIKENDFEYSLSD
ncbi:10430_t:CDS:2, partial [Racocetra persica]